MSKHLHDYYEKELAFIGKLAADFARKHPKTAGRLLLDPTQSRDTHVERMIQAFALLAGRVHSKLDDDFPELTDALLGVIYPHYLAPVPSMAVVEMPVDPMQVQSPEGKDVPRGTKLQAPLIDGVRCTYQTVYPVKLWPVVLRSASLQPPPYAPPLPKGLQPPPQTKAVLRLELECRGEATFSTCHLGRLRFYLAGKERNSVARLYELIFNDCLQVAFCALDGAARPAPVVLKPDDCLHPVGFELDEGALPYPRQSFLGYRLLTEFFAFPNKFQFVDLGGWTQLRAAGLEHRVEVILFLRQTDAALQREVEAADFRLHCTPIVNLFEKYMEPFHLTQRQYKYPLIPDADHKHGYEVYSVDDVSHVGGTGQESKEYFPFYSYRHGMTQENGRAFWFTSKDFVAPRRDSDQGVEGVQVHIQFVDLDFDPRLPGEPTVVIKTTCTNRDLPMKLQQQGDLTFDLQTALTSGPCKCLHGPTVTLRPPQRQGMYWRLLAHLNLNYLSLAQEIGDADESLRVLREILRLYDFSNPDTSRNLADVNAGLLEGILSVRARRVVGRVADSPANGFARGIEVTVEFDEEKYHGTGMFLFACVLERFLGLYVSMNSFSQMVGRRKSLQPFKIWSPRSGSQQLL